MEKGLSIIIPVCNGEKYISRAINSVLAQSYHNVEVVVVNDGSTDGTADIVDAIRDRRVTLVNLPKSHGVSNARNLGLKKAKQEYVMFLDADDYLDPNIITNAMQKIGNCDLLMFGYRDIRENSKKKPVLFSLRPSVYSSGETSKVIFEFLKYGVTVMACWAKIFKRTTIKNIKFDDNMVNSEDLSFMIDFFSKKPMIKMIPDVGYNYCHPQYKTYKYRKGSIQNHLHTADKLTNYAKINSCYDLAKPIIADYIYNQNARDLISLAKSHESYRYKKEQFKLISNSTRLREGRKIVDCHKKYVIFIKCVQFNHHLGYILAKIKGLSR